MANPNAQNTARNLSQDEVQQPGGPEFTKEAMARFDAISIDQPGGGTETKSLQEAYAEEYANKKGIPVKFPNKTGQLIEGRLVEWNNGSLFTVVGFDGDTLTMRVFHARQLYAIPENSSLNGAVEFAREHAAELADTRSQIGKMLTTVFEAKEAKKRAA